MKFQSEKTGAKSMTNDTMSESKSQEVLNLSKRSDLFHVTYTALVARTSVWKRYKGDPWLKIRTPLNHWESDAFNTYYKSTDYARCIDDMTNRLVASRPRDGRVGMELVMTGIRYYVDIETYQEDSEGNVIRSVDFKINTNHRAAIARMKNEDLKRPYFRHKGVANDEAYPKDEAVKASLRRLRALVALHSTKFDDWGDGDPQLRRKLVIEYKDHPTLGDMITRAILLLAKFNPEQSTFDALRNLNWNQSVLEDNGLDRIRMLSSKDHDTQAAIELENLSKLTNRSEDYLVNQL